MVSFAKYSNYINTIGYIWSMGFTKLGWSWMYTEEDDLEAVPVLTLQNCPLSIETIEKLHIKQ